MTIERSQQIANALPARSTKPLGSLSSDDASTFIRSRSFAPELAEAPDLRAAVVARGKALIADPNYPAPAHLKAVARVLAGSLRQA